MISFKRGQDPHKSLSIGKYEDIDYFTKIKSDFAAFNPVEFDWAQAGTSYKYIYIDLYWTMEIPVYIPTNIGDFKTANIMIHWDKKNGTLDLTYLNENLKPVITYTYNDHTIFAYYEILDILLDFKFDLADWYIKRKY